MASRKSSRRIQDAIKAIEDAWLRWRQDCDFVPSKSEPTKLSTAKFSLSKEPDLRKK